MQTSKQAGPTGWSQPHVTPHLRHIIRLVGGASYLNLSRFFMVSHYGHSSDVLLSHQSLFKVCIVVAPPMTTL